MATYNNGLTFAIDGTPAGDLITLDPPMKSLRLTIDDGADGECWVRAVDTGTTGAAPSATPAPSAGAPSDPGWRHLKGKGSTVSLPSREFGAWGAVEVWGITAGGLVVELV